MGRAFVFSVFAGIAVASAVLCITRRSPVASALWLVNTLFHLAGIYVLLDAHFIAAAQVLVYAGAIMVLFLFVIMLLNLGRVQQTTDLRGPLGKVIATGLGLLLVGELIALRSVSLPAELIAPAGSMADALEERGAVTAIALPLFQQYLVPFEVASVMLLAAIVGAVVLAKRRL